MGRRKRQLQRNPHILTKFRWFRQKDFGKWLTEVDSHERSPLVYARFDMVFSEGFVSQTFPRANLGTGCAFPAGWLCMETLFLRAAGKICR